MPNIMMFGFEDGIASSQIARQIIFPAMRELGLADDAMVTYIQSAVVTCDGKEEAAPYIRICSTNGMDELLKIAAALKERDINVDCELLLLPSDGFIEAKDMRSG